MKRVVSAILLVILFTSMLYAAFKVMPVGAAGTIYIRADGSIDPPDAPVFTVDNVTYTLTGNITSDTDGIGVGRSNIVIDGDGFAIHGSGSGTGICLSGRENVTVRNTHINGYSVGILLNSSSNYSSISGNIITNNYYYGVWLNVSCYNNVISENNISDGGENFGIGILLGSHCFYNSISGNNIVNNDFAGIFLFTGSYNNSVSGNNIAGHEYGVSLFSFCYYNTISGNNITDNEYGFDVVNYSHENYVFDNNVTNNEYGITLSSDSNFVYGNNIRNNGIGLDLSAYGNHFFHNNFIDNTLQVYKSSWGWPPETCDDGYPSGGNYWSDYEDVDWFSGPNQNEFGSDGIWDHPYLIQKGIIPYILYPDTKDRYPLVDPLADVPKLAYSFRFPLVESWTVSQGFGRWNEDFQGYHLGEDVLRSSEVPVYSPANGVVKHNAKRTGYGYVVIIEHQLMDGSFVCSVLGHLREEGRVTVGSTVAKGQLIGYLSSLPDENGGLIHVHFGIRKGIYSEELDFDGKWRYRGYGPAAIADYWHPPSQFIDYYNIQKTPTLPEEEGLRVTITSDKTFYQLNETINFNVTVTNPTNETGINIVAHNSSLIIEPPAEIELENPQTFYDLGDLDPGESRALNFTAIASKAGTMLKTWARAAGEDIQLGLSMIGDCLKQFSIGSTIPTEWSFAVITDSHIGRSDNPEVETRLEEAVSAINALRTDGVNITFVLVLGDITDAGGVNDYFEAQRILNRLNDPNQDGDTSEGIPYIPLIGNHDVKSDMEWCFDWVFWSPGNGNNWDNRHLIDARLMDFEKQDHGEAYYQNYYFSYDGLNFLCIDDVGTHRYVENWFYKTWYPEQTRQFVQHHFDMNRHERFIVASHIPLYEDGGFSDEADFEQDIDTYDCNVTNFAGHTHRNYDTLLSNRFRVVETEAVSRVEYNKYLDPPARPVITGNTTRIVSVKYGKIDDYSTLVDPETVLEIHRELWRYRASLTVEGFASHIQPNKPAIFKAYCIMHHGFETSFQWAFGDGDYGSSVTVSHSYLQEGDYNVTLNITERNLVTNETTVTTIVRGLCVRTKHLISALPSESFATSFPLPVDLTEVPSNTYCQAVIGENTTEGEKPIAIIGLHFENADSDIDLSNLLIDTDTATKKSVVFSAYWPAEVDCEKGLFIPSSGTGSVYVCLNATSLNDVKLENADFVVNDGETVNNISVATVYYNGREYYLVYGNLTGLGAGERALVLGDLNLDWTVNIVDIVVVALEFGHPPPPIVDLRADVNKDGLVNIVDIVIVALHFGETG